MCLDVAKVCGCLCEGAVGHLFIFLMCRLVHQGLSSALLICDIKAPRNTFLHAQRDEWLFRTGKIAEYGAFSVWCLGDGKKG